MAGKRSAFSTYNTLDRPVIDSADQSVKDEFARRLQERMQKLNWNQSELARHCAKQLAKPAPGQKQNLDFGRDRISRYCRGLTLPRPESLPLLAKALGCEESDLLPAMSVPSAAKKPPSFDMRPAGGDHVYLTIYRKVTMATATKIINLLTE
jgi:transcriptional regulator with XRE-family HTH domain